MAVDRVEVSPRPPAALVLAVGFAGGLLSGLFGVGGGVILVPAMVALLGMAQHRAQGTSLAIIVPTAIVGVWTYARYDPIPLPITAPMAAGAVLLAYLAANLAQRVPALQLKLMFFVLIVISAVRLFFGGGGAAAGAAPAAETGRVAAIGFLTGALAGLLAGLLGVGGGIIMVPLSVILLAQSQQAAQGISLAVIIPTAFAGAWASRRQGNVDLRVAALIAAAAVLGSLAGATLAHALSGPLLRRLFAVALFILADRSLPATLRRGVLGWLPPRRSAGARC